LNGKNKGHPQVTDHSLPYARKFTRDDGFVAWEKITSAMNTPGAKIERFFRALTPWPGLWTEVSIDTIKKRLKILQLHLDNDALVIDTVQLEGKNPAPFAQFVTAYHPSS
jgi:methionyl-tRNA formyltransferase